MYEPRYGNWHYNPESFLVANFEWAGQERFAAVGALDGSVASFKQASPSVYAFDLQKGYANFHPTGQTHPLNTKINYSKVGDPKNYHRFFWQGTVVDGKGSTRQFRSSMHAWLHHVNYKTGKKTFLAPGSTTTYQLNPNVWTPYQLPIYEERKPNGNIICYSYERWKDDKYFPHPHLLQTITAYNSDKTQLLGSLTFQYTRDKKDEVLGFKVIGSDGRELRVAHQGNSPILLHSIQPPDKPSIAYRYQGQWINRVDKPEGRVVTTKYDGSSRVAAQYAPIGPSGEMHPIGRYVYHDRSTEVLDAEGHKTVYHFNEHKQILAIEVYQGDSVYHTDRFTWDATTGNLLKKTLEDSTGTIQHITEYGYDHNHNPILEKVGDGNEWHTIHRTFSNDGLNLKLSESDQEGRTARYTYLPNTNLLTRELVYEGEAIRRRTFLSYDDCAICIRTIVDDGFTEDPDDLQGLTYRKITEITPKRTLPCFGLPECVQEKSLDESGLEILLKRVTYTYAPFGKVLTEEHYDGENNYRYTITNSYDARERLAATTDPLGHQTAFNYDANNNLTSIRGPKSDQYREIAYDQANRPIRISDWQSDGSVLTLEKSYNKLGEMITESDACGNVTHFEYDDLGRVVATTHPDGAIERKEYDIFGNVIKEIDAVGYQTLKTYDFRGKPLSIHIPDGKEEHFTYHSSGTLATHIDQNGAKSLYAYDIFNNPVRVEVYSATGELFKTTSSTYSPFYKLTETDGEGITTHYIYDMCGRVIAQQTDTLETHYSYNASGFRDKTDLQYFQKVEEFDEAGHLMAKWINSRGEKQFQERYAYDESSNRTHLFTSHGAFETRYNTHGKPLVGSNPLGHATHYDYHFGKEYIETTTDANGIQTLSIYDTRGREAQLCKKNLQGEIIAKSESQYDQNSNLTALTQFVYNGTELIETISHSWEYGPMNRLERFIEAGEKESLYRYDAKGRLQTTVKPSGIELHHEWDDLGRLTRYYSSDFDYQYTYDRNDRVLSVYEAISKKKTTRSYNSLGGISQEEIGNGLTMRNTFDKQGRRIVLTLPDGSGIHYSYRGAYLYAVTRKGSEFIYATRDPEGQLIEADLPGQLGKISIERDPLSRIATYDTPFFSGSFSEDAYDPVGNLLLYDFQDSLGKVESNYSYDDLNQLSSENEHTYICDSINNRRKKDEADHQVNALCQTTHDGCKAYEYDPDGNLLCDGEWHYTYDTQDRLIALERENERVEYEYDPFHRRLSKKLFKRNRQIKYERYLWDGDNEIGAVNEKGAILQLRVLGEGLGAEIGAAVLLELKGKCYVPIHDHRGCLVTLVDLKTKKVTESYRYTAFGEELTATKLSPWRFSSKRVEEETGLVFFGRRYYHPELGRWITQDPEGFDDGPNLYAYLSHSPLSRVDLYGLNGFSLFSPSLYDMSGIFGKAFETFGRDSPCDYRRFENFFTNKSRNVNLNSDFGYDFPEMTTGGYFFGNGVGNSIDDLGEKALLISGITGFNTHCTYNATHGIDVDAYEALLNLHQHAITPAVEYYHQQWDHFMETHPNGEPLWQACHSQGAAQVRNALEVYPEEKRNRIIVAAFSPFAYISPKLCGGVAHYV
ncbi:MAG: tRNA nuclease WapA, partial [Chlamydiae bacterium]|nr:tRNA nuclease WapA [Chlamydiota bacterium]